MRAEHMRISNLTGKRLKNVKQLGASVDLSNKFKLLIKESLLIKYDQSQLNKTIN